MIRKFAATFESYWNQETFESYLPARDAPKLDAALGRSANYSSAGTIDLSGLEVRPYAHQIEMLDALTAEREVHGRHRNLIIAATGTGKTVVAALDFRNLSEQSPRKLRLLFVAHRVEILQQSMRMYREVLMDAAFGELLVDGKKPTNREHVFASVQSLKIGLESYPKDHFDVIVIDEFHHAEARTYQRILDHFKPVELLGLTATPERSDGVDVKEKFFEGRAAAELRLWDALSADLLVPFHYFGVADGVDLDGLDWKRGYDTNQLDQLYTGNTSRAGKIVRAVADKVTSTKDMRALAFCVSVEHAKYMTGVFNAANIPSATITGSTPSLERKDILRNLSEGAINCIFSVDVLNEGLDIPQVDTILMLRPTQSTTIFLQQLGRGLRRSRGKTVLTVLDFIGQQRKEFRFDSRFRALTGIGRAAIEREISEGFPYLPPGSQIVLDRVVQEIVLNNIRVQLRMSNNDLARDISSHVQSDGVDSLATYLSASGRTLTEVYRRKSSSWTGLRRLAGLKFSGLDETPQSGEKFEGDLLKRMSALIHVDDPRRARAYCEIVGNNQIPYEEMRPQGQAFVRMLLAVLWPNNGGYTTYEESLAALRSSPAVCDEIMQVVNVAADASRRVPRALEGGLDSAPILSHATYRREEILAGLSYANLETGPSAGSHREGTAWAKKISTDILLVTLHKSERKFSPNTMYKDFALSPSLFHWESQNNISSTSVTGQRYLNRNSVDIHAILFTRNSGSDDDGLTGTYSCLGQVDYFTHEGERPIGITWKLRRDMPADIFLSASSVAR